MLCRAEAVRRPGGDATTAPFLKADLNRSAPTAPRMGKAKLAGTPTARSKAESSRDMLRRGTVATRFMPAAIFMFDCARTRMSFKITGGVV